MAANHDGWLALRNSILPTTSEEWRVIFRDPSRQQVIEYQQVSDVVSVRRRSIPHIPEPHRNVNRHPGYCPLCHQPLQEDEPDQDSSDMDERENTDEIFMDHNYFRLLGDSTRPRMTNGSETPPLSSSRSSPAYSTGSFLDSNYFNQGYYAKFFQEERRLGRGLRGSVFLCRHVMHDVLFGFYAVKKVAVGNNPTWLMRMLEEVHTLEQLQHPNIISYKHAWIENAQISQFGPEVPYLFILMEFASGGTLDDYLNPPPDLKLTARQRLHAKPFRRYLSETEIWSMFTDVVAGLHHLHQHNILHRDLKPNNLLLSVPEFPTKSNIPRVMISDFGESALLSKSDESTQKRRTGNTGTLDYMAPELLIMEQGAFNGTHTRASDVWSLGLVLFYLCYADLPFQNLDNIDLLREEITNVQRTKYFEPFQSVPVQLRAAAEVPPIPQSLVSLIRLMLVPNPEQRPTTDIILSQCILKRQDVPFSSVNEPMLATPGSHHLHHHTTMPTTTTPFLPRLLPPSAPVNDQESFCVRVEHKSVNVVGFAFWFELASAMVLIVLNMIRADCTTALSALWNLCFAMAIAETMMASQLRASSFLKVLTIVSAIRATCLLLIVIFDEGAWNKALAVFVLVLSVAMWALRWRRWGLQWRKGNLIRKVKGN